MQIEKFVKKFQKINKGLYLKAKDPLRCHGLDHHQRVCANALLLAKKIGHKENIDYEVLIAACFLHDLSAYESGEAQNHHQESAKLARKVLKDINFPLTKTSKVLDAISGHGSDAKSHPENEPIETTLLRDADKMDALGPIGIARMIMARAKRGDSLEEIVNKFHGSDIKRRWQAIKTKEAKVLTKENYQFSRDFFAKLHQLLKD